MSILLLAAIPGLLAIALWALTDVSNFVVYGLLAAMVFPASLVQPGGTNIDAADLMLLLVLGVWVIRNSLRVTAGPWFRGNVIFIPAVIFVSVALTSAIWSTDARSSILFAVQVTEITIAFPIVFASLPTSVGQIRRGLWVFIALTVSLALYAMATYAGSSSAAADGTYLPGFNKNALGSVIGAGLMLAYAFWNGSPNRRTRMTLALVMLLQVAGLIASGSRGSMLGAGVGALAIGWLLGSRRTAALFLAASLAALYVAVIAPAQATKTADGGYNSSVVRPAAWAGAIQKIRNDPWLGSGAATYTDTLNYPVGFVTNDPLNLFLLTWAELGIPGMLALLFLLYRMGTVIVRARTLERDAAVLAVGLGGLAISFFIHFQVDISWVRGETTLEFAGIGLAQAVIRLSAGTRSWAPAPTIESGPQPSETPDLPDITVEPRVPSAV